MFIAFITPLSLPVFRSTVPICQRSNDPVINITAGFDVVKDVPDCVWETYDLCAYLLVILVENAAVTRECCLIRVKTIPCAVEVGI
jgi:hypothetical protein